jgi:putative transcriptional regulator
MRKNLAPESRGRVDWEKIRSLSQDEIDRLAAIEDAELGIDRTKLKGPFKVYNSPVPNVRAIRKKLGLSQSEFSRDFHVSDRTVQEWEQGRSQPDQPARVLLEVIARFPDVVRQVTAIEKRRITAQIKASKRLLVGKPRKAKK